MIGTAEVDLIAGADPGLCPVFGENAALDDRCTVQRAVHFRQERRIRLIIRVKHAKSIIIPRAAQQRFCRSVQRGSLGADGGRHFQYLGPDTARGLRGAVGAVVRKHPDINELRGIVLRPQALDQPGDAAFLISGRDQDRKPPESGSRLRRAPSAQAKQRHRQKVQGKHPEDQKKHSNCRVHSFFLLCDFLCLQYITSARSRTETSNEGNLKV